MAMHRLLQQVWYRNCHCNKFGVGIVVATSLVLELSLQQGDAHLPTHDYLELVIIDDEEDVVLVYEVEVQDAITEMLNSGKPFNVL